MKITVSSRQCTATYATNDRKFHEVTFDVPPKTKNVKKCADKYGDDNMLGTCVAIDETTVKTIYELDNDTFTNLIKSGALKEVTDGKDSRTDN